MTNDGLCYCGEPGTPGHAPHDERPKPKELLMATLKAMPGLRISHSCESLPALGLHETDEVKGARMWRVHWLARDETGFWVNSEGLFSNIGEAVDVFLRRMEAGKS